ncbi:MAG: GGDEF domain-containing protein [Pseudobdellovibrionaceae bacterium]|nr:GGDEF domain-containing protein [Bdellovibrionales bacterium]USN46085.1 MAG: GGDEF domain-containing protein [Pseudobdellovibrionaceae bacterium]
MKQWMQKLIDQFDFDWRETSEGGSPVSVEMNEERATLIYIIDILNKHLIEVDKHPVRKVRETLDEFAKELVKPNQANLERVLFRFRQFFSSYRIDEVSYMQKTFDDFRSIIWDFVDQLSEDMSYERSADSEVKSSLDQLKEAVEANSIDILRTQSRLFIDFYTEYQTKKDERRLQRIKGIRDNLSLVKKQLVEANQNMRLDHLTSAYNRKSFDEQMQQHHKLHKLSQNSVSLLMLDIDHFKKFNDTYGHAIGDFVLVELVKLLHALFHRDADFVARIGGEEFAVILPDHKVEHAVKRAQQLLEKVRGEVFVQDGQKLSFTVSVGVAQLQSSESVDQWMKRADAALYESKNSGRNKFTVAEGEYGGYRAA